MASREGNGAGAIEGILVKRAEVPNGIERERH